MPSLSDRQSAILESLIAATPDSALRKLEQALASEVDQGGALAMVHGLAAREAADRRLRSIVFAPFVPLGDPRARAELRIAPNALPLLWQALHVSAPELIDAAEAASRGLEDEDPANEIYDRLCARAVEALRVGEPAFAEVAALLSRDSEAGVVDFCACLDLAPLARVALERLDDWLGRMSDEKAAAIRVAYKDAVAMFEDGGPRLVGILFAHLDQPWTILRILAAVLVRPNERFLAASELARFGEFVLGDIDRHLTAVRTFDPDNGRAAGARAAEDLHLAAQAITEFETTLDLGRDGPWGARVAAQKRLLARQADERLAQIDKAVDLALPLQPIRFGKGLRGIPKLAADPDPRLVRRAEGLLGFFDHVRVCATSSGFGASRGKVGDRVAARLEQYVEDLLETLRAEEFDDVERIHTYLDVAAGFLGDVLGEKAAQIARRRAAAA